MKLINSFALEVETPSGWVDVTGPSTTITVNREDGQPGTIVATVLDADLDPTQSTQVQMGKRARLRVADEAGTGWVSVYTGSLEDVSVKRNPLAVPWKTVAVELNAVDVVSLLANTPERRGVATIDELRGLITGVPFVINGSSAAGPAPTVVAGNDNATLWDQILVTRDSALGYAWVDPDDVLQAWDADQLDTTPAVELGPNRYGSVDTDFALDQLINSVTILFRRYNIGTEQSVDVPYGPYEDAASIAQWRRRGATFTIQAEVEDVAEIEAYAAQILARSATAVTRVRSARVPIRDVSDLDLVRDVDLNTGLTVVLPNGYDEQTVRVTGITHEVTPAGWVMTLTFAQAESVSAPLTTPGTSVAASVMSADSEGTPRTVIDPATGRISATGSFATSTGYDDVEIVPGDEVTPSAVNFRSDGTWFDDASPASLSCFDAVDGSDTVFRVRLQGAKSTQYGTIPRIDVTTTAGSSYLRADIAYHAGGAGAGAGVGRHEFYVDGTLKAFVDSLGLQAAQGAGLYIEGLVGGGTTGASINDSGRIVRSASSREVKQDIRELTLEESLAVLGLVSYVFRYRPEAQLGDQLQPGFMAEQAAEVGLELLVIRDADGTPVGFRYDAIPAAHNVIIRHLCDGFEDTRAEVAQLKRQLAELQPEPEE